jgi:uncharacterized cupredoxin-like copper-binding protein
MKLVRRQFLAAAAVVTLACGAGTAFAKATVIKVALWDKGAMTMNMLGKAQPMGMAMEMDPKMPPAEHKMGMGPMGIKVSAATVPSGDVTFNVTNTSKQMMHEMVISPVADPKKPLPYNKAENKVDEDAAGHLGEVADLEAGKKGSITITMKPGTYLLYCNIPGHYVLGMWTLLTVK